MTQWISCYKMSARVEGLNFGMTNIYDTTLGSFS